MKVHVVGCYFYWGLRVFASNLIVVAFLSSFKEKGVNFKNQRERDPVRRRGSGTICHYEIYHELL